MKIPEIDAFVPVRIDHSIRKIVEKHEIYSHCTREKRESGKIVKLRSLPAMLLFGFALFSLLIFLYLGHPVSPQKDPVNNEATPE